MATIIGVDGSEREVSPGNGHSFTLEEMQGFVQGYIQILGLPDGRVIVMNEEGKLKGMRYNLKATLYARQAGIALDDEAVGPVLLCSREEAGFEE